MSNATIHQFVVVDQVGVNRGQVVELAALFDEQGNKISFDGAQNVSEATLTLVPVEEDDSTKIQSNAAPGYYWSALAPGGNVTTGPPSVWTENDPDNILSVDGPSFGARLQGSGLWCLSLNLLAYATDTPSKGLSIYIGASPLDWEGASFKYIQKVYLTLEEDMPEARATLNFYADEELNLAAGFIYNGTEDGYWSISEVVISVQRIS